MANVKVELSLKETDEVQSVLNSTVELLKQIEISNFKDENGHDIKSNIAYQDLVRVVKKIKS